MLTNASGRQRASDWRCGRMLAAAQHPRRATSTAAQPPGPKPTPPAAPPAAKPAAVGAGAGADGADGRVKDRPCDAAGACTAGRSALAAGVVQAGAAN